MIRLILLKFLLLFISATLTSKSAAQRPFGSGIQSHSAEELLGITDEQKEQIADVFAEYKRKYKAVRSSGIDRDTIAAMTATLRDERDRAVHQLLLPHQLEMLKRLPLYNSILSEGFCNSVANGVIGRLYLKLDDKERESVNQAIEDARSEYLETVSKAQAKLIREIKKSLSEKKQKDFEKLVSPLLRPDGTFWTNSDHHLRSSPDLPTTVIPNRK